MVKIICMASAKGGSGKTILTATFAAFLNALGKSVLIIDTDASTNGLTLMYLKEVMIHKELLVSENIVAKGAFEIESFIDNPSIITLPNNVHFLPASYAFNNTEIKNVESFAKGLKQTLKSINTKYDFIFLDAQAGTDLFANVAMRRDISNEVVIVSEYDPLSAAGIERLKAIFRDQLTYDRTWVLLNKMLPDFVQSFSDFLEVAKYLSPIPWDADVVRAYARRRLALDLERGNEFTLSIMQTLKSLFGDLIETEIDTWLKSKDAIFREPIETQYSDTEKQINHIISLQYELEKLSNKRKKIRLILTSLIFIIAFVVTYLIDRLTHLSFKGLTDFILYLSIGTSVGMMMQLFLSYSDKDNNIENEQTKRKIISLEEKLQKLDSLKNSKTEILIKNRSI